MFKKLFSKHDIYLTGLLFALLIVGLVTLFSTTRGTGADNEAYFYKQAFFVVVGLVIYFSVSFIPLEILKYKWSQIFIYAFTLILLIAVLLFTAKVKGASRWFVLPLPIIGSINIQPADIAKITAIIVGSFVLTQWEKFFKYSKLLKNNLLPYLVFSATLLGLILIQPALGTSIIIFFSLLLMYYFSVKSKFIFLNYLSTFLFVIFFWIIFYQLSLPIKIIISLLIVIGLSFTVFKKASKIGIILIFVFTSIIMGMITRPDSINYLGDYQKDRVLCWQNPESDPTGKCFQQIQAKIAIGSGELFGRGFSQGKQDLPEFQNDFIYAAFAEQYGFIGTVVLLLVFFLFLLEVFRLSTKQKSEFSRVAILGAGVMFTLQIFINITMNTGLLPTTGISLPFMSYGGSFLWVSLFIVGLVQNLSHHKVLLDEEERKYVRWDDESDE